ncbi:MAG: ChaN family lipoprotein [Rubrivivax sp.]|nr:ChaN family lipoprotein [Rubrivivax sp.]
MQTVNRRTALQLAQPQLRRRRWWAVRALAASLSLLAACAGAPVGQGLVLNKPVVLLGEVHDNAAQHALRLRAFEKLLASGARPALALEQFDRNRQADIDRALAQSPRPDADALIAAAGGAKGWHWPFYRPFIELALRHDLPIVAANVPASEARAVMRDGLAASGFDPQVPDAVMQAHALQIQQGHCGQIDAATAGRMALAQVARDQYMARVVQAQAGRGVVLLAGNGHVRNDIGIPRWLDPQTRQRSEAIGVLETGDDETAYDRWVHTTAQSRSDPCAALMRKP